MGGRGRHFAGPDTHPGHRHHHPEGHHRRRGRGGGGRGRLFDYGELRLLLLAMIAERPRHGYELIKDIEERFGGSYSPSPGVIYPTLAWLDDAGYASVEPEPSGRKLYRLTSGGEAFLLANRAAADELLGRGTPYETAAGESQATDPVLRAMRNLKLAVRLRLKRGSLSQDEANTIAAALDAAAQAVERN